MQSQKRATVVHVHISRSRIGLRAPAQAGIHTLLLAAAAAAAGDSIVRH